MSRSCHIFFSPLVCPSTPGWNQSISIQTKPTQRASPNPNRNREARQLCTPSAESVGITSLHRMSNHTHERALRTFPDVEASYATNAFLQLFSWVGNFFLGRPVLPTHRFVRSRSRCSYIEAPGFAVFDDSRVPVDCAALQQSQDLKRSLVPRRENYRQDRTALPKQLAS